MIGEISPRLFELSKENFSSVDNKVTVTVFQEPFGVLLIFGLKFDTCRLLPTISHTFCVWCFYHDTKKIKKANVNNINLTSSMD